jgi:hypothetical protein
VPRTKPLNAGDSVKLDSSGGGAVTLTPTGLEQWHVTRMAVVVSTAVLEPTAKVYVGSVSEANLLSGTYSGALDSSNEDQTLQAGQPLVCVWAGGDANATATFSVFGEVTS